MNMYGIMMATSFVAAYIYIILVLKSRGVNGEQILYSFMLSFFMMIAGAKIYSVIINGFQVDIIGAGMASMGAAIGIIVATLIIGRIIPDKKCEYELAYFTALPLFYGVSKIGCYFAGCCGGILHVQLLESISNLAVFLWAVTCVCKRTENGKLVPEKTMIASLCLKFVLDFLRDEHTGKMLSVNQVICILIIILVFIKIRRGKKVINNE